MSDHHIQLPSTELDQIFTFAKDCFLRSMERFTGDVTAFNRNGNNDFFITEHTMGYIYLWKTGVVNKMIKDIQQKVTIPVDEFIILNTPAHGQYPWHNEGMEHTEHATEQYRKAVRETRRSVAINYPIDNADLTKSRLQWAQGSDKVTELLIDGYSKIANKELNPLQSMVESRVPQATIESHIRLRSATMPDSEVADMAEMLYISYDSGEGVKIKSGHSIVYDKHDELLTKVDEYYGMPVPTLIRTNQWHMIDNTQVEEDRNMGSISFDPAYSYFDIKKLIMNNEFIK